MTYREASIAIRGRQTRLLRGGHGMPQVEQPDACCDAVMEFLKRLSS